MDIGEQDFRKYIKTKEAFLKIYAASNHPTDKESISLTYEECNLLLGLFDSSSTEGLVL